MKDLSFLQNVQTSSRAHPTSYAMGIRGSFCWGGRGTLAGA